MGVDMRIPVVFRVWGNGDVIALFPDVAADAGMTKCLSYEHVGQHGAADYAGVIEGTRPAKAGEHAGLSRELGGMGYDLRVLKRRPASMRPVLA